MIIKRNNFVIYSIILIFGLLLCGCTAKMNIDTNDADPILTVYGMITSIPEKQKITLSSSAPYFSDIKNDRVSGAKVIITGDNGEVWELLENNIPGVYFTTEDKKALSGVTYTLNIECDFNADGIAENYSAQTYVYPDINIDDMFIEPMAFLNNNFYNVFVSVYEPAGENFYMYRYYVNGVLQLDKLSESFIVNDEMFDGQYIENISFGTFHSILDIDKFENQEDIDNSIILSPGDLLKIEMSEISKHYYNFIYQCEMQQSGENPMFGGPAANITTNISGGACGFFSSFNPGTFSAVVPL